MVGTPDRGEEAFVSDSGDSRQGLTRRQREVLEQAALGMSNRQIGEQLNIAEQTVKNHLSSAMLKLDLHDRTHAVVMALGEGWIAMPIRRASRELPDRAPAADGSIIP
jgi:DNA-binding NarL/FixJ family response regulator